MTHPARYVACIAGALIALSALPAAHANSGADTGVSPERAQQLVRMVRQDCGSCHGMHLTGGLGPALTRAALAPKASVAYLSAVISHGIPGTPMPPWQALISASDADWIAAQLLKGFPEEPKE